MGNFATLDLCANLQQKHKELSKRLSAEKVSGDDHKKIAEAAAQVAKPYKASSDKPAGTGPSCKMSIQYITRPGTPAWSSVTEVPFVMCSIGLTLCGQRIRECSRIRFVLCVQALKIFLDQDRKPLVRADLLLSSDADAIRLRPVPGFARGHVDMNNIAEECRAR